MIHTAFDQATARDGVRARTWVGLVDGDPQAEAARRGVTIHIVCDLVHVIEYCWRGARCLHAAAWTLGLLVGEIDQIIDDMTIQAAVLPTGRRDGLETAVRYPSRHRAFLCYDRTLQQVWPIATGVVEGTAHHPIGARLEITEARWGLASPEPKRP